MNFTIHGQLVRVKLPDGDVHWMTPLGFRVMRNHLRDMKTGPPGKPGVKPRTHCKNGHLLSGDNVQVYTYGRQVQRVCLSCRLERGKQRKAAREARREVA